MTGHKTITKPEDQEQPRVKGLDETPCCARFSHGQPVKIPLGDGSYQHCIFVGMDMHGVSTVKTQGGRYKQVWDCNLYLHNA
jgi:hypothetical protein